MNGVGELVIPIGPSGCGKSWWFWGLGAYSDHQMLSLDKLRLELTDDIANMRINPVAVELRRIILENRARQGLPTVLDATNTVLEHRRPILAVAARYQRPTIAVVFHTPLRLCLHRQRMPDREPRPGQPNGRATPDEVVTRMWQNVAGIWDRLAVEVDCVVHVSPDGSHAVRVGDVPRPKGVRIDWLDQMPARPSAREVPWPSPYAREDVS